MDHKIIQEIKTNVIQGRINMDDEGFDEGFEGQPATLELIDLAIKEGVNVRSIVVDGLTEGMKVVGKNFENGLYLIPDMLASAEAVGAAMQKLASFLEMEGIKSKGKVVMATVKGDLHDIGKNIVATMLKGAGFEVIDLGTDVSETKIMDAIETYKPNFLGLSALLTTTMTEMDKVIKILDANALRDEVHIMIGGAPTCVEFAEKIGADVYCADGFKAVEYVNSKI